MTDPGWHNSYLRLHPQAAVKNLEQPFVYHLGRDELYEIDDGAADFLARCTGLHKGCELTSDGEFVAHCLKEGLLETLSEPEPRQVSINQAISPSLRYLELQLLDRCNLKCRHCYLGQAGFSEMALRDALHIAQEFSALGGLRLMISGGEPLLYKELRAFIEETKGLPLRRVLLTNGTLIHSRNAGWLQVDEIQFSLDGWTKGHDMLRGAGAFERTMQGIRAAKEAGIPLSFATMIHKGNVGEFLQMRDFMDEIGAIEWGIDMPALAGSLHENQEVLVPYEEAVPLMDFAYGGGYHGSSDGYACGRHLLTVLPSGQAVKCGFYSEQGLGDARRGLKACWMKLDHIPISRLECRDCPVVAECAGGCRFRAPHPAAPDPFMCALYGRGQQEGHVSY